MTILIRSANRPGSTSAIAANVVTITQTTAELAQFASEDFLLGLSKAGAIAGLQSNTSCLIRLYSSAAARAADARAYNVAVPSTGVDGLIAEAEIDPTAAANLDVNVIFANTESPQQDNVYGRIFSLQSTASAIEFSVKAVVYLDTVTAVGGGGGTPTFTGTTELLIEDKTISNVDSFFQLLDPGEADRTLTIPTSWSGLIINDSAGAYGLILSNEGLTFATLDLTSNIKSAWIWYSDGAFVVHAMSYFRSLGVAELSGGGSLTKAQIATLKRVQARGY